MSAANTRDSTLCSADLHRRAQLFVRALWGRALRTHSAAFNEKAAAPDETAWDGPYLEAGSLYLPLQWEHIPHAADLYRAAAAHAVAHQLYGAAPISLPDLNPRQHLLIGLMEDSRVEALACRQCPGLRKLWLSQHGVSQLGLSQHGLAQHGTAPADSLAFVDLIRRLSRCLLDPGAMDTNTWIEKGVALFQQQLSKLTEARIALDIGLRLAHDLGQMRITMNQHSPVYSARYRDDNRHLWQDNQTMQGDEVSTAALAMPRDRAFLVETGHGRSLELALTPRPGANRSRSYSSGSYVVDDPDQPRLEYRRAPRQTTPVSRHYPEWHYQLELLRQHWCTLRETVPTRQHSERARHILSEHQILLSRLHRIAQSLRLNRRQRLARQLDGDDLDLNAAILTLLNHRAGRAPDYRVYQSVRPFQDHALASLLLLDLSESGNDPVSNSQTVLDLARTATLILTQVMDAIDEPFAVHGFHSSGRHDIRYYCFKDFSERVDDRIRGRIAAAEAAYSTRLGTAVRHASAHLHAQAQPHKLLVLITDGAPADIDSHDPGYLAADARDAVQAARRAGIQVFCLSLDPDADRYVARLFGQRHYRVLDHVERLPTVLPAMFFSLSRQYL